MKNTFLKYTFLFFAFVLVASCSSDDDGPAEAPPVKFRASIGGQNVRTDNVNATLSNNGARLTIVVPSDTGIITLSVGSNEADAPEITTETYVVDEAGSFEATVNAGAVIFSSNPDLGGAITITEINLEEMTVFGSFTATLANTIDIEDTIEVTNGALFNVNFTVQ